MERTSLTGLVLVGLPSVSMNLPTIGRQAWRMRFAVCALILPAAYLTVWAQTGPSANSAALEGRVHDAHNQPIADATVLLETNDGMPVLTVHTDAQGSYRFAALPEGSYLLRAEKSEVGEGVSARFLLGPKETRKIDLSLVPARSSSAPPSNPRSEELEFFDEPHFTVAGVTDPANAGGHGSDAVLRTTEALTKETVALSRESGTSLEPDNAVSNATTEKSLRETVEQAPGNFDANRRLGTLLVEDRKAGQGLPYLEQASRLQPDDYATGRELAIAYADTGEFQRAREKVQTLLARQDRAELHHLLADIDEKAGNPLEAVEQYQRSAELDPSESNFFDWGADLLMHRAAEPAIEVFSRGSRLFPHSARMLLGLGVTWYSRGSRERAIEYLCQAADLNPKDHTPYLFLGKLQSVEIEPLGEIADRMARFVRLQPENALANYYYAVGLWKGRPASDNAQNWAEIESLLEKAVRLDPKLAVGYLQLGIVYSERGDMAKAVSAYLQAIAANPRLAEAHYRLAHAYWQLGNDPKAQSELELYSQISEETTAQVERERSEIRQFVYTLKDQTTAPPNPSLR